MGASPAGHAAVEPSDPVTVEHAEDDDALGGAGSESLADEPKTDSHDEADTEGGGDERGATSGDEPVENGSETSGSDQASQIQTAPTRPLARAEFCSPGEYFTLGRTGTRAHIHRVFFDNPVSTISNRTERVTPTGGIPLNYREGANALGVTRDGVFYFTDQSGTRVQIHRFDSETGRATTRNATLNRGGTLVAGAVDPNTDRFFFGNYTGTSNFWQQYVDVDVYMHDGVNTRRILTMRIEGNSDLLNGDFAFDGDGNLLIVMSSSGDTNSFGKVLTATVSKQQIAEAIASSSTIQVSPTSVTPLRNNAGRGVNGYNGVAFTGDGRLIVEQGSDQYLSNPYTFEAIGSKTTLNLGLTLVDLASCMTPPSLTIQKDVEARAASGDQFTITARQGSHLVGDFMTTGNATGVQAEQIGPAAVLAGMEYTVEETFSANAENYTSEYSCTYTGESAPAYAGSWEPGEDRRFSFTFDESEYTDGKSLTCVITNAPLRPDLKLAKSANPESGTAVTPGDEITYTLTFDNSEGQAAATVDHVDHLADVLDDADLGTITSDQLTAVATGDQLEITGEVPAGKTYTVSYTVTVKPNTDSAEQRAESEGGYVLRNFVTEAGEEPPAICEEDDPCTTHDVPAWNMFKAAFDSTGEPLPEGGTIANGETVEYRITATRLGPGKLEGVRLVDDLTEVLAAGTFTGAASVTLHDADGNSLSGPAVTVNGPTFHDADETWSLRTEPFDLPADAHSAVLTYAVEIGDPQASDAPLLQMGTEFVNSAQGDSTTIPPNQCVIDQTPNDPECETTHIMGDGFFHIAKVDPEGAPLSDHEFRIVTDNGGEPTEVDADATWEKDGDQWFVRELAPGTYWVIETKTTAGHELLASPVRIEITSPDGRIDLPDANPEVVGGVSVEDDGYLLVIPNPKSLPLPMSGALNPRDLTIAGSLILAAALLGVAWRRRRIS